MKSQQEFETIYLRLEELWNGPLTQIRYGTFTEVEKTAIEETLNSIQFDPDELLPRKIVTCLWFMPQFMEWQVERITPVQEYKNFCLWVSDKMGEILGNP